MDLLTAFRTIYYIYLLSRSQANQVAAKTTLTQLLHIVFQRIELKVKKKKRNFFKIIKINPIERCHLM